MSAAWLVAAYESADKNIRFRGRQSFGISFGRASTCVRSTDKFVLIKAFSLSIRGISPISGVSILRRSKSSTKGRSSGSSWVSTSPENSMGGGVPRSKIQRQARRGRRT